MIDAFIGLGGNIGDTKRIFAEALQRISLIEKTFLEGVSRFYTTAPLSPIPQPNFLNAVCKAKTLLDPLSFFSHLQKIEKDLGKNPKPKESPRILDLDLLIFGTTHLQLEGLTLPHPEWQKRLFVLIPLYDLVEVVPLMDPNTEKIVSFPIKEHLLSFPKKEREKIRCLQDEL